MVWAPGVNVKQNQIRKHSVIKVLQVRYRAADHVIQLFSTVKKPDGSATHQPQGGTAQLQCQGFLAPG